MPLIIERTLYQHGKPEKDRLVIVLPDGQLVDIYLTEIKSRNKAMLSVEFPRGIGVYRGELWDRMRAEKKDAK